MQTYLNLLNQVLTQGSYRSDRTQTGTYSLFGYQMRFDLQTGFPLVTTKKIHWKSVVYELLWFLKGDTNVAYLQKNGVTIWNEWANPNGDLGPVYGKQWRQWLCPDNTTTDQLAELIQQLKTNPFSRRHVVSAWNVADLPNMALPPCHCLFQFYVHPNAQGEPHSLSCQLYQRSADVFLGVPFNIASYALLTHLIAHATQLVPHEFVHTLGDAHLYSNHTEQARLQLQRLPFSLPTLTFAPHTPTSIFDIDFEHIILKNYTAHPSIKASIAV